MADELKLRLSASYEHNSIKESFNPGQISVTVTTPGLGGYIQTITTGSTTIVDFGDVSVPGYAFLMNVSTANYVEVGPADSTGVFVPFIKLKPGEPAVVRLSTTVSTMLGRANTTSVQLSVKLLPD